MRRARFARAMSVLVLFGSGGLGASAWTALSASAAPRAADVTPNGPGAVLTFTAGGQTGTVSVQGLTGQQLTVTASGGSFTSNCGLQLTLLTQAGATVGGPACAGQSGAVSVPSLPSDGLYKASFVSGTGATGSVTVAATSSAGPPSITTDAAPVTVSITSPSQDLRLGFTAAKDALLTVSTAAGTLPDCNVTLRFVDALGVAVGPSVDPCAGANGSAQVVFPKKATFYAQLLHNATSETGTVQVLLSSVADQTGTITTDGTPVSVSTVKSGQNARFTFSGTSGQRVAAQLTSSTFGPDCPAVALSLLRPDGTSLGTPATTCDAGAFLDTQTLDQTGTWTVFVDPQLGDVGTASLAAFTSTDIGMAILRNGTPKSFTLSTPGQNARYTFSGIVGQQVSALLTGSTIVPGCPAVTVSFVRPDGTEDTSVGTCTATAFLDSVTVDQAGTWTILVDPRDAATGAATLQAYNSSDQTGVIALDGTPAGVEITSPGQNARWRFSGSVGQTVSAQVASATFTGCPAFSLSLVRPDGTTLGDPVTSCGAAAVLGSQTLDQAGLWKLVVDPQGTATGTATLQASGQGSAGDDIRPINVNGAPVTINLVANQNGRYTFDGTAGQLISAQVASSTFPGCTAYQLWLQRPDQSQLGTTVDGCGASAFLERQMLDATGTWSIVFDPQGSGSGTASLQAYSFVDATGTVDLTGKFSKVVIGKPGQNAQYTFSGTNGSMVSLLASQSNLPGCPAYAMSLARPNGSTLGTVSSDCGGVAFLDTVKLDATGTWTVVIDPQGPGTGAVNLRAYGVVDDSRTLTPKGPIKSFTSQVPGMNGHFSFPGHVGDHRTVTISFSTFGGCPGLVVSFVRPNGTVFSTNSTCNTSLVLGPSVLDTAGTWSVLVDPQGAAIGTLVIKLT